MSNFAGQWLYPAQRAAGLARIRMCSPISTPICADAFQKESELFFESMRQGEDRSVLDLLNANYTFVNERLARHYGIPNVYGSHFRPRHSSPIETRNGLLGQGSILTVTSYATRTAPTIRGSWLLENILGIAAAAAAAERSVARA